MANSSKLSKTNWIIEIKISNIKAVMIVIILRKAWNIGPKISDIKVVMLIIKFIKASNIGIRINCRYSEIVDKISDILYARFIMKI